MKHRLRNVSIAHFPTTNQLQPSVNIMIIEAIVIYGILVVVAAIAYPRESPIIDR